MPLNEGSHPGTTALQDSGTTPEVRISLFYWPVDGAFDVANISRSNISCLYLRTLHEICDCVMVESSMNEVQLNLFNFPVLLYLLEIHNKYRI